jgi:hypothetical protein
LEGRKQMPKKGATVGAPEYMLPARKEDCIRESIDDKLIRMIKDAWRNFFQLVTVGMERSSIIGLV